MWSKINEVLQNKKRLDETLQICDNGMTISDHTKTVTKVNNYFKNVAQELAKNQEKQTKSFRITGKIPMNTVYF